MELGQGCGMELGRGCGMELGRGCGMELGWGCGMELGWGGGMDLGRGSDIGRYFDAMFSIINKRLVERNEAVCVVCEFVIYGCGIRMSQHVCHMFQSWRR